MKTAFHKVSRWAADHRRIVMLALLMAVVALMVVVPTVTSHASFSVDAGDLVADSEPWFNLLWPVARIGLGITIGIGILMFVMKVLGRVFGGGGLRF